MCWALTDNMFKRAVATAGNLSLPGEGRNDVQSYIFLLGRKNPLSSM